MPCGPCYRTEQDWLGPRCTCYLAGQSQSQRWKICAVLDILQVLEPLILGRFKVNNSARARASNETGSHTADGCGRGLKQLCPVKLEDEAALHLVNYLRGDVGSELSLLLGGQDDLEILGIGRHGDVLKGTSQRERAEVFACVIKRGLIVLVAVKDKNCGDDWRFNTIDAKVRVDTYRQTYKLHDRTNCQQSCLPHPAHLRPSRQDCGAPVLMLLYDGFLSANSTVVF